MAPLKHEGGNDERAGLRVCRQTLYPWLRGHGSIEAGHYGLSDTPDFQVSIDLRGAGSGDQHRCWSRGSRDFGYRHGEWYFGPPLKQRHPRRLCPSDRGLYP